MRILWLKTEVLHPVDKGGKIRTYNMLKELKREHHVTYLTLDDGTASAEDKRNASEYCHELICIPHARREKFTPRILRRVASQSSFAKRLRHQKIRVARDAT